MTHLLACASMFPYDSKIDSVMGYHHLVAAYSLTWVVHLCYLGYVIHKRRSARSLDDK
ncbi:MAG: hypothetical protein QOH35_3034 [Acidobacteriaceae bacterium]|nr:hypothetical protein [Acidobacteriaceae bacterium]MEA2261360.1 hypothetical protein [Acidobacteriaceae bacterium]MEA2541668.1 hypothetical protein [Acidobacteriaceae bacterium]